MLSILTTLPNTLRHIPHINEGGCLIFACLLHNALGDVGIASDICGRLVNDHVFHAAVMIDNNIIDSSGVWSQEDSKAFVSDRLFTTIDYSVATNLLKMENWNTSFDRRNIELMTQLITEHIRGHQW